MKKTSLLLLAVLSAVVFSSHSEAKQTTAFARGPVLHWRQKELILRLQAPGARSPVVEWTVGASLPGKIPLQSRPDGYWEAPVPFAAQGPFSYRIVDGTDVSAWMQRAKVPARDSLRIAAYGDNRSGWRDDGVHRRLLDRMKADAPDLILHTGDIVHHGYLSEQWDTFFRDGADIFPTVPLMPSVGNHDLSRDNRFAAIFPLGVGDATYFAFRQGPASFIALDTTIDSTPSSPQYRFLIQALEAARGQGPVVVYFHHPPFNAGKHGDDAGVKEHLVPVFAKYKVALVLAGHDHNYQRFAAVDGVTYLVTGGGGGPLYEVQERKDLISRRSIHHYLLLDVTPKFIKVWVKDQKGDSVEHYEIGL